MSITMSQNPLDLFTEWFQEAQKKIPLNSNAAALATATKDGKPSVRIILVKQFNLNGFVFYTNIESRKGIELKANPFASLCFYWRELNKQIRIEGQVEEITPKEADAYFKTRARESKIVAWVSHQSHPYHSIEELHQRFQQCSEKFNHQEVPRPEFWSGFRLKPNLFEFWKHGDFRLHERVCYRKEGKKDEWTIFYLYP